MSGKGTSTIQRPDAPRRASDRGRSRLGDITRPVQIDRRITRRRRSTFLLASAATAIAGALAAALFVLPVRTYLGQDDQTAALADELSQLQAVNADLRSEVERLGTDDGVREAAREELGFMEQGERRESVRDLPPVPTDLPDGWPYSVVTGIVELRTNPPAAASPAPTVPADEGGGATDGTAVESTPTSAVGTDRAAGTADDAPAPATVGPTAPPATGSTP